MAGIRGSRPRRFLLPIALIAVALSAAPAAHPATPPQLMRCTATGIMREFSEFSVYYDFAKLKVNVSGACTGGPDGKYTVTAFGWGSYIGFCSDVYCDHWNLQPQVSLTSNVTGKTKTRGQQWTSEYFVNGSEFAVNLGGVGIGAIDYGSSCGEDSTMYCENVEIKWSFTYRDTGAYIPPLL